MEVFILTVINKDLVDMVEVFDSYDRAYSYISNHLIMDKIPKQYIVNTPSAGMHGTVVVDSPEYFIWILTRPVYPVYGLSPAKDDSKMKTYNDIADIVNGKLTSVTPTVQDLPWEDSFPIGFSEHDNRPLKVSDAIANPYAPKSISELTENQKWALTVARVSKRPAYKAEIKLHGQLKTFNQAEALDLLKSDRYVAGAALVKYETDTVQDYMNNLIAREEDESSSSSEYEDEE